MRPCQRFYRLFLLAALIAVLPSQLDAQNPYVYDPSAPPDGRIENARARHDYFYDRVTWPGGSIQAGARARAWKQALTIPLYATHGGGMGVQDALEWTNIGPDNIGGRIFALVLNPLNPATMYVGAADGGIWKSYDEGLTWRSISDDLPTQSMGSIVINPLDTNVIYAGTGDASFGSRSFDGGGVFRSTNGGETWTEIGAGTLPPYSRASDMAINPSDPSILYLAIPDGARDVAEQGIWRSKDAGDTWELVLDGRMTDIVINPVNPDILYTVSSKIFGGGTASRYGVFKTTDGGDTWDRLDIGVPDEEIGRTGIGICATQPDVVYLGVSHVTDTRTPLLGVFKTTDAGASWNQLQVPFDYMISQGWFDNIIGVHPTNPDIVYAGGVKLIRSSDGGRTWDRIADQLAGGILHVDQHEIEFNPLDPDRVFVGNDGGLFLLTDEGHTLEKRDIGLSITQFIGGDMYPGTPSFMIGGTQDNGTLRTESLPAYDLVLYGDGGNGFVHPTRPNIMYTTQERVKLWRSEDFGRTWNWAIGNLPNEGSLFYVEYALDREDPSTLYLGTYRMYKTTDEGRLWRQLNSCPFSTGTGSCYYITSVRITPYDHNVVLAAAPGQTGVSSDGGENWTVVNGQLPLAPVSSFTSYRPGIMYATISKYEEEKVWVSTDWGNTWSSINGDLPDIPANDLLELDGKLILATDLGAFISEDNGTHWQRFGTGMPSVSVQKLRYQEETGVLRAITHGRGNYDLHWKEVPPSAPVFVNRPDTTTLDFMQPFVYAPVVHAQPQPTFRLLEAPSGATVDAGLGIVRWTGGDLVGRFTLEAENSAGSARIVFTLHTNDVVTKEWEIVSKTPTSTGVNALSLADDGSLWMARDTGWVSRSVDAGRNWEHFKLPETDASVIAVYPFDRDNVIVGTGGPQSLVNTGSGHIWKSTDGGGTWRDMLYGIDSRFGNFHFFDRMNGIAVSQGSSDSADVFVTADGGETWTKNDERPYARIPLYNTLHFLDGSSGWFASSNIYEQGDASVLRTTDGGRSWESTSAGSGVISVGDIAFLDDRTGFLVDDISGKVRRTVNGGARWSTLFVPMTGEHMVGLEADPASRVLWLVSDRSAWFSRDDGRSWTETQLIPAGAMQATVFADSLRGWVVGRTGIVEQQVTDPLTGIAAAPPAVPGSPTLHAAYPNPAGLTAEVVMLPFSLPSSGHATLKLYNASGQELRTVLSQDLESGRHMTAFDLAGLSSGVYFVTLTAGGSAQSQRIVIAR
jgi:photosystem II stability/assembly factor-like uncharacterized protein